MQGIELKPCPFCGGEAEVRERHFCLDVGVKIKCTNCNIQTFGTLIDHPRFTPDGLDESTRYTREQAIEIEAEKWNRRVEQKAKKPIKESLADYGCPTCGAYINFDGLNGNIEHAPKYCSECGQRIDWGEDNDTERKID